MLLTDEEQLIQQSTFAIAQKVIRPYRDKWEHEKSFPMTALKELGQAGLMGMLIPEEWGGTNLSHVAYVLAISELAKADGAISTIVSVHNSVVCLPILQQGTQLQKEMYLKPMAQGKLLGAFCLTEPQAGSDAANIQTKAVREGDFFILNGVKQFITSGKHADLAIVFALTTPELKSQGISAFIVPTHTPGYIVSKIENKMGQEAAEVTQIVFDNLKIPVTTLLGELNHGYKIALNNLECGRLGIAAQAIGMADEAMRLSLQYVKERKAFGKYLFEHEAIAFKLANMATELEAARRLLFHAASLRDHQQLCLKEASMAKLFATEIAENICKEAIQIYGGYGYLKDFPLERIYRDVRVTSIYEGTSDIQRMIIARELMR